MSVRSADEAQKLTRELTQLSEKHCDALETAGYLKMSKAEAKAFDERCERIGKICQLLRNYRSEQ